MRATLKLRRPITALEFDVEENQLEAIGYHRVRQGKWGKNNECSECGCQPWFENDIHTLNFCPECGALMVEEWKNEK